MTFVLALAALLADVNETCEQPQLQIASVTSQLTGDVGAVNHYDLRVVVANSGGARQPSDVLQSVSIYQDGSKVGEKGVPPLGARGSYAFDQPFQRSDQANAGTTSFTFRLHPDRNASAACYGEGDRYRLTV
jgi:hypothetical protein